MRVRFIVGVVLLVGTIACGQSSSPTMPSVSCVYSLTPSAQAVAATGGTLDATMNAAGTGAGACGWTAAADVAWITITSGSAGVESGGIVYTVANNAGATRRGTITARAAGGDAATTVTVQQAGIE